MPEIVIHHSFWKNKKDTRHELTMLLGHAL